MIKVILFKNNLVLISRLEEVGCKLIEMVSESQYAKRNVNL